MQIVSVYCLACVRGRGKGGQASSQPSSHMPTFQILSSPPITENGATCLMPKGKMHPGNHPVKPRYGSLTYDHQKGDMLEWPNEDMFQAWLVAEEQDKTIKLIMSYIAELDSPNWQVCHMFRCSCELSSGKTKWENKSDCDQKIPSKKTGCKCQLIVKQYLGTETMLGKYQGEHDHPLGNNNLWFLRLSTEVRNPVMDMVDVGMGCQAIVSNKELFICQVRANGALQMNCVHATHKPTNWDYYITMCDITCLHHIVEEDHIHLDCYVWTSPYYTDTLDCFVSFSHSLTLKPLYDTIWWVYLVRYNLTTLLGLVCTISISEPCILRYLVLGALRSLST